MKIIQASLAICGMFDISSEERNGLLCDVTCEGIHKWIVEIGEPCMDVEVINKRYNIRQKQLIIFLQPTERIADPSVVAALLSMVLTTRNKLHALGYVCIDSTFISMKEAQICIHFRLFPKTLS